MPFYHLDIQVFNDGFDDGDLSSHVIRHRRPVGLIIGIHLMSEGGPPGIKDNGKIFRCLVGKKLQDHFGEAEGGVGRETL